MNLPENLKYSKDHEWLKLDGNAAIVGITAYAQSELGDVVYVDVNSIDQPLAAGEAFGTVEAVKTVSDLNLPVAGKITEVNPELNDHPELVNNDPYNKGWMVKMIVDNPEDVDLLMNAADYNKMIS